MAERYDSRSFSINHSYCILHAFFRKKTKTWNTICTINCTLVDPLLFPSTKGKSKMNPSCFVIFLLATIAVSEDNCTPKSLGCWSDDLYNRAIDGEVRLKSNDPIEDCHKFAKEKGFSVFAVQYDKECFAAADAGETYKKHGESNVCYNGRGGFLLRMFIW